MPVILRDGDLDKNVNSVNGWEDLQSSVVMRKSLFVVVKF